MADYYDTGTVTVLSGSRTVTGTGTSWVNLIRAGDTLEIGGRQMRVASVESATSLTLKLPAPAAASGAYAIWYSAPSRVAVMQVLDDTRWLIEAFEFVAAMRPEYEVQSATLNAPPASPVTSDMYLISTAPAGAWAGYAGHVARWTGTGWAYVAPQFGMRAVARDTGRRWARSLTAWALSPDLVSALAVSGNIADLLGSSFPRALAILGRITVADSSVVIRNSDGNTLIWFARADGAYNNGLVFHDISTGAMGMRTYYTEGTAFRQLSLLPEGHVASPGVTPTASLHLTPKSYVYAEISNQFTANAPYNGLESTIFSRNTQTEALPTGNETAASNLRMARITFAGAVTSHVGFEATGIWMNFGAAHNPNTDDISIYRLIG
ncbi:DUF2793 domain-containing protein [Castellaniella sp.]|uniref:DUF2793 domain-containing protein n=1 Tax=Castellaniella sp. TaxID=1955812 RepID=UPI002AFEFE49|nr:DUF2793 domain-containing protein [Castellaniella sp.]